MLNNVNNDYAHPLVERLNSMIDEYNTVKTTFYPLDEREVYCLNLLNEISYLVEYGRMYCTDFCYLGSEKSYQAEFMLFDFGFTQELKAYLPDQLACSYQNASILLNQQLESKRGLFEKDVFLTQIAAMSEYEFIEIELFKLQGLNHTLWGEPSVSEVENYYYQVEALRSNLFHSLSMGELDHNDSVAVRQLISYLNKEINAYKIMLPTQQSRENANTTFLASTLSQELSVLSHDDSYQLNSLLFSQKTSSIELTIKQQMNALVPALAGYTFSQLGGDNNMNWKITHHEEGLEYVLQVGEPNDNQLLLDSIKSTPLSTLFSPIFFSTPFEGINIRVTELATKGDIYTERKNMSEEVSEHEILQKAAHRIGQITQVCQLMKLNNIMHKDIKLTNFLLDDNFNIVMADKKAFTPIGTEGRSLKSREAVTEYYKAPELDDDETTVNSEAYMVYQLGLALYEYIIQPEILEDQTTPLVCDFSLVLFDTNEGEGFKALIEKMICEEPEERIQLMDVQTHLTKLSELLSLDGAFKERQASFEGTPIKINYPQDRKSQSKNFLNLKKSYSSVLLKEQKKQILKGFELKIEACQTPQELKILKKIVKQSNAYKILESTKGRTTLILTKIGAQTSSINELTEMFKEKKKSLNNESSLIKKN